MKRLILCLVLAFCLAQFSYLDAQEELVYLGSITDIPAAVLATSPPALALRTTIVNASGTPYYYIEYASGQAWDMEILFLNLTDTTQTCKLEFDLRYGNGAGYYVKRLTFTNLVAGTYYYRLNVTSYVAKRGLLTLTGRVYGAGMGNDNKVTAQVIVY